MSHPNKNAIEFKFSNPLTTLDGSKRASVDILGWQTLWFNTGTLCNIKCKNCNIKSSPTNDDLLCLTSEDIKPYLAELKYDPRPAKEIGFTGGEPFMNPDIIQMLRLCLADGFDVLVLTNAMEPMMHYRVKQGILGLLRDFGDKLTLRISLDHFRKDEHDREIGEGSFEKTLDGMRWLRDHRFSMRVAGRSLWFENDERARSGYRALFEIEALDIDPFDPLQTVIFPEMDETVDVPEITSACWSILGKNPRAIMCSSSRMVVKRKATKETRVIACTLLPYQEEFDISASLKDSQKPVYLNHPHCANKQSSFTRENCAANITRLG